MIGAITGEGLAMPGKLSPEELVTLATLSQKGQSNAQIARALGVTEGTVRYHLRHTADGATDGRRGKPHRADPLAHVIDHWLRDGRPPDQAGEAPSPSVNVRALHDYLVQEHAYRGSYRSVLRFVRARYPTPRLRPFRRVETPPGAQAQADWGERAGIDIGRGPQPRYAFVMVLSHSRKEVVVWSERMDQLAWHHAHNEAFRRLGGVPAVVRIDNLKTGIAAGAGPWGRVNPAYRSYARCVGFHIDACLPRCPEDKGKVESKVGAVQRRLRLSGPYPSLAALQGDSDEQLARWDGHRTCPATGLTVQDSWLQEQRRLRPLPLLPEVFDVAVTRVVQRGCTVNFEGRTYSVPFPLCGLAVEVRGCAETVQVVHEGRVAAEHPRASRARIVLDPAHYEGPGDDRVAPPVPLGRMG
ncbi:MAG: IS21 family transposase, partial [Acidobacteriota bacterium]